MTDTESMALLQSLTGDSARIAAILNRQGLRRRDRFVAAADVRRRVADMENTRYQRALAALIDLGLAESVLGGTARRHRLTDAGRAVARHPAAVEAHAGAEAEAQADAGAITWTESALLVALLTEDCRDGVGCAALTERAGLRHATGKRSLARLCRYGLVTRRRVAGRYLYRLTDTGLAAAEACRRNPVRRPPPVAKPVAADPRDRPQIRKCLGCDQPFRSAWAGNRLCGFCAGRSDPLPDCVVSGGLV